VRAYEATSTIKAEPAVIWAVLTDAPGYPRWDSGIERIEGRIGAGEKIKLYSEVSPGRAFPLRVTGFEPGRRLVWSGGMPLGLFRGVRTFTLTPAAHGVTEFRVREEFTGPLVPLIWRTMPELGPSFVRFAEGLKARAESDQG
jgi:hypothetical protein